MFVRFLYFIQQSAVEDWDKMKITQKREEKKVAELFVYEINNIYILIHFSPSIVFLSLIAYMHESLLLFNAFNNSYFSLARFPSRSKQSDMGRKIIKKRVWYKSQTLKHTLFSLLSSLLIFYST